VAFSISHAIISREEGENIRHLAAIYFTYLYWVSIIWIIFCIVDIIRHKRKLNIHSNIFEKNQRSKCSSIPHFNLQLFNDSDQEEDEEIEPIKSKNHSPSKSFDDISDRPTHILTRRHTLDPNGIHTLRNYVSHRKDTIVQRVIGYNYDDHSTAGGLYIRVGIGSKEAEPDSAV
jgi:hypothetical protein